MAAAYLPVRTRSDVTSWTSIWVFVVPVLARLDTDPGSSEAMRAAALVPFQAIHQYGGVVIGEPISQFMTVVWMALISGMMLRSALFQAWQGWLGLVAALIYLLAQSELLATVIPGFPEVPMAGLIGSLLWLLWMIVLLWWVCRPIKEWQ